MPFLYPNQQCQSLEGPVFIILIINQYQSDYYPQTFPIYYKNTQEKKRVQIRSGIIAL